MSDLGRKAPSYFDCWNDLRFCEAGPQLITRSIQGGELKDRRTVIVEDVISTGGAVLDAAGLLRAEGANLCRVVCAIWRGPGAPHIPGLENVRVSPLLTQDDLATA